MFIIRDLGLQAYTDVWEKMKVFTSERKLDTVDEIWLLEHHSVYTQGQAGKAEHILNPQNIPIVQTDRGGQVTYHGPGQLIAYFLLDCKKNHIGIKQLVNGIENLTIDILKKFDIQAHKQCGAPGVYVNQQKIASLGLRIKNNYSYHGLSINVDMDLSPFQGINPCGFKQLQMVQTSLLNPAATIDAIKTEFNQCIMNYLVEDCLFKGDTCKL
jgi:lipoyl(octanoyl) transferase